MGYCGEILVLRRHAHALGFGNMGVLRHKTQHPGLAMPRRQPVGEPGDFPAGIFAAVEIAVRRLRPLGQHRFQPDQVETETGIERIVQRVQPFLQQPHHPVGVARGPAQAQVDPPHHAIGAEEAGFQPAQTQTPLFQNFA